MQIIPEKFIELSKKIHGYKDEFYYINTRNVSLISPQNLQGELIFRPPAYLRINDNDKVFNNTEVVLSTNQISYIILTAFEHPNLFFDNAINIDEVIKIERDLDSRFVVRKQTFVFHRPITTETKTCPFNAEISTVKMLHHEHKFLLMTIVIGDKKNYRIESEIVLLKESVHNTNYT